MKRIWVPQVIISLMLLCALNPGNPYEYYTLLRWLSCSIFVYLAYNAFLQNKTNWTWIFIVTSLIYNPIIKVHLTREIWSIINLITISIALISIRVLKNEKIDIPNNNKNTIESEIKS